MTLRPPSRNNPAQAGFALVGVLVVLTIIAMGMSLMMVFADRVLDADREDAVTEEIQEVFRAMVGDQRDTFGYMGEVGTYPASLVDLAVNPGNAGWRGPYLRDPRTANSMLLDPWGQPYEYFIVDGIATSDQLAIVSRGPDGQSTNTAPNPNLRTAWTGVAPTAADYFTSDPRNADNIVFPRPDPGHADALNVNTDSILNIAINNYDENNSVQGFVPACPNLFNITVTNTARGTNEVPPTPYAPPFQVTLPQGTYQVFVTSTLLPAPPVNDRIVVFPVVPVNRTYNVTGLDSSGTDPFTLTITNGYPLDDIDVYNFSSSMGEVSNGDVETFTPKGCSKITVVRDGGSINDPEDVLEAFTMPHANYTRTFGGNAAAIEVENDNQNGTVDVYANGIYIGDVRRGRDEEFGEPLVAGDVITVKLRSTGALVGGPITLIAGLNYLEV